MQKPKSVNALLLPIKERFEVWRDARDGRWHCATMPFIDFEGVEVI